MDLGRGLQAVDWEERVNFDRMRKDRIAKIREALTKANLDLLLLFRLENIRYATGLRTHDWPQAHFGMAALAVTKREQEYLYTLDYDHVKARCPWLRRSLAEDEKGDPVTSRGLELETGAITWAQDVLRRCKRVDVRPSRVGVDIYSPALSYALPRVFENAELLNGQAVMIRARSIKTHDEILCLKLAYDITMAGMYEALEFLRPGRKECEVLGVTHRKFHEYGGEWTQCANIVCSGPYTAPYRRFTSDRIIGEGDPVIIDIGSRYNGYWGDYTRTWICGEVSPSKELVDFHMRAYEGLRRAEKAIKPGATTEEVALACGEEQILNRSLGHGIGVGANDSPFIGIYPGVIGKDAIKLEPGMVFSIEPYVGKPGVGGIRLEDNFIVTEEGCECISAGTPFESKLMK
jgi:Xaa-Pro aminopeptidase